VVLVRCRGAGPPGVEADEVDRGGGEDVFEVDFVHAGVAGAADPGDRDGLTDGAFDTGADAVACGVQLQRLGSDQA
jgi:hypothetical protein